MMFDVLTLQRALERAALPSGSERLVGEVIEKLARPFVDETYFDVMGNLICHKKGDGRRIMLSAHMDVIGVIATYIDEHGFVWFDNIGGLRPMSLIHTNVRFANGVKGAIQLKDYDEHMGKPISAMTLNSLYIDIGARDRAEAMGLVSVGDVARFDEGEPVKIGGGNIMGSYADDLAGCVALLLALERAQSSTHDLYFVFSTQEEVGLRGAQTAAYGIAPEIGIAVDGCYAGDAPDMKEAHVQMKLGCGPTIKIKDASVICSPWVVSLLKQAAERRQIKYQREVLTAGGTDTAAMQRAKSGVHSGCISIPMRHIHSPCEIFNERDLIGGAEIIAELLCSDI